MKAQSVEVGKVYFIKAEKGSQISPSAFGTPFEVNSNFDQLKILALGSGKALGITANNDLYQWDYDKKNNMQASSEFLNSPVNKNKSKSQRNPKKNDYQFLLQKPIYHFHKIKFRSVTLNKSICLGLDVNGNVLVWGQNKEGLLGLGYEITVVETPTILDELKDIVDISLSDYHAVALNSSGVAFSWGLGKYGELGLERSIYSAVPQPMDTESLFARVFCGNLITCMLDFDGHFSYFGVIIKQLGGYNSTITVKNLLSDQNNFDNRQMFSEKEIIELESEKFKDIVIGNGFIGLLSNSGSLFTLEYSDKLTLLYCKYYLYSITVCQNEIYGLAKEHSNTLMKSNSELKKNSYYLCKWISKCNENEVSSDIWTTTIYKVKEDFSYIQNCKLLGTNGNRGILLLLDVNENAGLNYSVLNAQNNKKFFDSSVNDDLSWDNSINNNINNYSTLNDPNNKKIFPDKVFEFESEFDDTFNIRYKRCQARPNQLLNDSVYNNLARSRSLSPYLNRTFNNIRATGNLLPNLNRSNLGANNSRYSAYGSNKNFNYSNSPYNKYPTNILGTNTNNSAINAKDSNVFANNLNEVLSGNNKTIVPSGISTINLNLQSASNNSILNNNPSPTKATIEKDEENVNIYDNLDNYVEKEKEKEMNKYKLEIDDIINNFREKQNKQKKDRLSKYNMRATGENTNAMSTANNPVTSNPFNNLESTHANNNRIFADNIEENKSLQDQSRGKSLDSTNIIPNSKSLSKNIPRKNGSQKSQSRAYNNNNINQQNLEGNILSSIKNSMYMQQKKYKMSTVDSGFEDFFNNNSNFLLKNDIYSDNEDGVLFNKTLSNINLSYFSPNRVNLNKHFSNISNSVSANGLSNTPHTPLGASIVNYKRCSKSDDKTQSNKTKGKNLYKNIDKINQQKLFVGNNNYNNNNNLDDNGNLMNSLKNSFHFERGLPISKNSQANKNRLSRERYSPNPLAKQVSSDRFNDQNSNKDFMEKINEEIDIKRNKLNNKNKKNYENNNNKDIISQNFINNNKNLPIPQSNEPIYSKKNSKVNPKQFRINKFYSRLTKELCLSEGEINESNLNQTQKNNKDPSSRRSKNANPMRLQKNKNQVVLDSLSLSNTMNSIYNMNKRRNMSCGDIPNDYEYEVHKGRKNESERKIEAYDTKYGVARKAQKGNYSNLASQNNNNLHTPENSKLNVKDVFRSPKFNALESGNLKSATSLNNNDNLEINVDSLNKINNNLVLRNQNVSSNTNTHQSNINSFPSFATQSLNRDSIIPKENELTSENKSNLQFFSFENNNSQKDSKLKEQLMAIQNESESTGKKVNSNLAKIIEKQYIKDNKDDKDIEDDQKASRSKKQHNKSHKRHKHHHKHHSKESRDQDRYSSEESSSYSNESGANKHRHNNKLNKKKKEESKDINEDNNYHKHRKKPGYDKNSGKKYEKHYEEESYSSSSGSYSYSDSRSSSRDRHKRKHHKHTKHHKHADNNKKINTENINENTYNENVNLPFKNITMSNGTFGRGNSLNSSNINLGNSNNINLSGINNTNKSIKPGEDYYIDYKKMHEDTFQQESKDNFPFYYKKAQRFSNDMDNKRRSANSSNEYIADQKLSIKIPNTISEDQYRNQKSKKLKNTHGVGKNFTLKNSTNSINNNSSQVSIDDRMQGQRIDKMISSIKKNQTDLNEYYNNDNYIKKNLNNKGIIPHAQLLSQVSNAELLSDNSYRNMNNNNYEEQKKRKYYNFPVQIDDERLGYLVSEENKYTESEFIRRQKMFSNVKMNKFSIMFFCYLIMNYMRKMAYLKCCKEIANYQKYLQKKYALKILFRLMKKRIVFYKIKFMHRIKKIYKFLQRRHK